MCCARITRWRKTPSSAFLKKYPTDRRAADAEFWLGESLFQRQRYDAAAQAFLDVSTKHRPCQGAGGAAAARAVARGDEAKGNVLRHARRGRPQISESARDREARRRARAKACPLLTAQPRSRPPKSDRCSPILPTIRFSFSPSPAAPTRPRCWCWRRAGARRESAGRSLSPSPSTMACAPRRGAKRSPSSGSRARLASTHRTLRWSGRKPSAGLQEAARLARYRLLADAARKSLRPPRPHRAHARRSGRNGADPADPRQRRRRARRDGAGGIVAWQAVRLRWSGRCSKSARRDCWRRSARRASPMPTIRAIAILVSRGCGSADAMPALEREGLRRSGWRCWRGGCGGRKRRWKPWSTGLWPRLRQGRGRPARSLSRRFSLGGCRPK